MDAASSVPASSPGSSIVRAAREGCAESRLLLSRRAMLGVSAGLFTSAFAPAIASAASADPRLLVVVLRGGMDGLNVVVPHGDPAYVGMRGGAQAEGGIALLRSDTLALDGYFGLNKALPTFGELYRKGEAAAVHATCTPLRIRSHFETQDNLESGLPGQAANPTGWLNRLLAAMPAGTPIASQGAVQISEAPLLLRGPARVLGWSPPWFGYPSNEITKAVTALYRRTDTPLYDALSAGIAADRLAEGAGGDDAGVSSFLLGFRGAARLLSAPAGPRIAVLSVSNFDTHSDQGTTDPEGFLWGSLHELDIALREFVDNAQDIWSQTVIVMVTEFGRTVRVNGDHGTDHGVGTVALLAGGAVAGGKVVADWPGVARNQLLDDSDLQATTDLRSVFKGVLRDHIGVPTSLLDRTIFPGSGAAAPALSGLVKSVGGVRMIAGGAPDVRPAMRPLSAIERYRMTNPV